MIRTAVLGGLTAAFAAGGFFLGYSRTGQEVPLEVQEPDFRKVPRHHILVVLQTHGERLHLQQNQIDQVRRVANTFFDKDRKMARENWKRQVMTAEKLATGEWLPWMDGGGIGLILSEQTGAMFIYSTPWETALYDGNVRKTLAKIVGEKTLKSAYYSAGRLRKEDDTKAYDFAVSTAATDRLALTPLQQRQFATLRSRIEAITSGKSTNQSGLLPRDALQFKISKEWYKPIGLGTAFSLLDPRQRLVLRGMLWDRMCVEP